MDAVSGWGFIKVIGGVRRTKINVILYRVPHTYTKPITGFCNSEWWSVFRNVQWRLGEADFSEGTGSEAAFKRLFFFAEPHPSGEA